MEIGKKNSPKAETIKLSLSSLRDARYSIFGLGLVWSWIFSTFETSAIFPESSGIGINSSPAWMGWAIANALTLFICALIYRNRRIPHNRLVYFIPTLFVCAGTIISFIATKLDLYPLVIGGGVAAGIGIALFIMIWAEVILHYEISHIEGLIPAAFLVTIVFHLVLPFLGEYLDFFITLAMPIVSALLLLKTSKTQSGSEKFTIRRKADRTSAIDATRISCVLFVSYIVIGAFDAIFGERKSSEYFFGIDYLLAIATILSVVIVVLFITFSQKIDFVSLYKWVCPALIIAVSLWAFSSSETGFLSKLIIASADKVLTAITLLYVILTAKKYCRSTSFALGILHAGMIFGLFVGSLVGIYFKEILYNDGQAALYYYLFVLICCIAVSLTLVPQRKRVLHFENDADPDKETVEPYMRLAQKHGLTQRETEVLSYLAQGRSQPYIREALYLSKSTVGTHVEHIYQKVGVHSKQELIDLLNS